MRTRLIPGKRICEKFLITYELNGAQKAVDLLSKYYIVPRMKLVLDGRRVGKKCLACYKDDVAFFRLRGLKIRIVLHEFFHHLVSNGKIVAEREEREADDYAKTILVKVKNRETN